MRAFAYLSQGQAGWIEKEIPKPTGVDGVIRPLLVAPCTSDVHNVAINCLAPHRILGHEGLGEFVAVGEGLPGGRDRGGPPGDPGLAHRPLPAGGPPALQRPHHRAEALQL